MLVVQDFYIAPENMEKVPLVPKVLPVVGILILLSASQRNECKQTRKSVE